MPLTFKLESPEACTKNMSVYAVPYLLRGFNTVGPFEPLSYGSDVPDLQQPAEFLRSVQQRLNTVRQRRGLIGVDVFNLCNNDHSPKPKASARGPHRLERIGSLALAHEDAQPIAVVPRRLTQGGVELHVNDPRHSSGAVSPVLFMERTTREQSEHQVSHIMRSVPFGQQFDRAYVALDGLSKIYFPQ